MAGASSCACWRGSKRSQRVRKGVLLAGCRCVEQRAAVRGEVAAVAAMALLNTRSTAHPWPLSHERTKQPEARDGGWKIEGQNSQVVVIKCVC